MNEWPSVSVPKEGDGFKPAKEKENPDPYFVSALESVRRRLPGQTEQFYREYARGQANLDKKNIDKEWRPGKLLDPRQKEN